MEKENSFNLFSKSIYHIWIKSFGEKNRIGTFKDIERKLDYIRYLGCEIIWISPFFDCFLKDEFMHGYDVTDYNTVNPLFSEKKTKEDSFSELKNLINSCHKNNIKIIFDFVPNHTSIHHVWFNDPDKVKNYYIWENNPTLNQTNNYGDSVWHYSEKYSSFYYSYFTSDMADLNYENNEVRLEIFNIILKWLDFGFDGLRIDAARFLYKNMYKNADLFDTHIFYSDLRKIIEKKYGNSKFMVGEVWIDNDRKTFNSYFGSKRNPEFDILLDFDQGWRCVSSAKNEIDNIKNCIFSNPSKSSAYAVFINNHDNYYGRVGTELNHNQYKIKIALALNILRPNIPIIYYGTEIGMASNSRLKIDNQVRDYIDWEEVVKQQSVKDSILNCTRNMLEIRSLYPEVFGYGKIEKLNSLEYFKCGLKKEELISYIIYRNISKDNGQKILILANLSSKEISNFKVGFNQNLKKKYKTIFNINNFVPEINICDNFIEIVRIYPFSLTVYEI